MALMKPKERDFQIDVNRLDEEWIRQPDLYRRYAVAAADAKQAHEEVKNDLSVIRADVEQQVRRNPDEFGLSKVTEGAIKTAIDLHEKVREAEEAVIGARHDMDVMQAAVGALDHRKAALGDLVRLFLADYFSKPQVDEGSRDAVDDMEKKLTRKSQRRNRNDD